MPALDATLIRILRRWLCRWVLALLACPAVAATNAENPGEHRWKPIPEWIQGDPNVYHLLPPGLEISELRLKAGDDPRWAQRDWDDRAWEAVGYRDLPANSGINWLRFRVRLPDSGRPVPLRLILIIFASYGVCWDGGPIGSSGAPGIDRASEVAGKRMGFFQLSEGQLSPGEHTVALRFSNHRSDNGYAVLRVLLVPPAEYDALRMRATAPMLMVFGEAFLLSLVAGLMWLLAARKRGLLLLAGIFLSVALCQSVLLMESFVGFRYDWLLTVINVGTSFCALADILMVVFLVEYFRIPRLRWLWPVLAAGVGIAIAANQTRLGVLPAIFSVSTYVVVLGCGLWTVWWRRRGAWVALSGIVITLVWAGYGGIWGAPTFLKEQPIFLTYIALIALEIRAERRQAREAQLTAARLEIELLKKNLQPHFLFNTLTVLSAMVEEDSALAVKLIDDLAQEFRSLVRVSNEKRIPLGDELELCRTHLRIMSARTEMDWKLVTGQVDEGTPVPPALFLTLIENGFAHQRPTKGATIFSLHQAILPRSTTYVFFSPGAVVEARSGTREGGTGLRYVKARLEESFPADWKFGQHEVPGGWETTVEISTPPKGRRP